MQSFAYSLVMADNAQSKDAVADSNLRKKGYGIAQIPVEERTGFGLTVKGDTLLKVCRYKLSHPLASQPLIAEGTGLAYNVVRAALATPYARRFLDDSESGIPLLAKELHDTQGDSVEYWKKSITKGITQLDSPEPNAALLVNSRECTKLVSQATGLLRNTITMEHKVLGADDYPELDTLENDPSLAAIADATILEDSPPPLAEDNAVSTEPSASQEPST